MVLIAVSLLRAKSEIIKDICVTFHGDVGFVRPPVTRWSEL